MTSIRKLEDNLNRVLPSKHLFIVSSSVIILSYLAFFITCMIWPGDQYGAILFRRSDAVDTFMDFYNSIYDAMKGPYEHHVIYPPLCNLVFKMFGMTLSDPFEGEWVPRGGFTIRELQESQMCLIYYLGLFLILFFFSMEKLLGDRRSAPKVFMITAILCSAPMLYAVERGNIIIYSFVFLVIYFVYYNDKRIWVRELGYICLALSAAIKLYPALFGLLLIKDKRYKDAARTAIYGLFFTFIPFAFFGGFSSLKMMIDSIGAFKGAENYGISFSNGICFILIGSTGYHPALSICGLLAAAVLIISFFLTGKTGQDRWKSIMVLSLSLYGLMENCSKYNALFVIIPWIIFLCNSERLRLIDYIYALMFILMLAPIPLGFFNEIRSYYDRNTMVIAWTGIVMSVVMIMDVFIGFVSKIKNRSVRTLHNKG